MTVVHPKFPSSQDPTAQDTYAAVDTEVAAIKAKTDNLPAAPAAQAKLDTLHDTRIPGIIQAQTGDSFSRLGAPAGASVSADVAAIKTVVDTVATYVDTEVAAILAAVDTEVAAIKAVTDVGEKVLTKAAAVMVDNDTLFTVTGGPILVEALWSECVTGNDATATTVTYKSTPTVGTEQTISGASASLANAAAGASLSLIGTALSTAPNLGANGANLGMTAPLVVPAGTIDIDVGVGSTTGTWRHYLRYRPLATGITVA